MGEIHFREVTPLMLKTYERALDDVPIADLKVALLDTLRSVAYWPTPGHIRGKLDDLRSKREYYEEPKAKPPHGCPDCDGTTWVPVTLKHPRTGQPYEAVTSCACTSREPAPAKAKRPKAKQLDLKPVLEFSADAYPD